MGYKLLAWLWCLIVLILCGCSSRLHAQACVGGQCWIPRQDPPQRRENARLNIVIPRGRCSGFERFRQAMCDDSDFRSAVCPVDAWYIDQFPAEWQQAIERRGMPYFYFGNNANDYTVGYSGDTGDLLRRLEAVRRAPDDRAEKSRERARANELDRQRQEAEKQLEHDRKEREAVEARERARQAEEDRLIRAEDERRRREAEESESEDLGPSIELEQKSPPLRERVRPAIREGVQVAGKAAAHWAFPKIIAALGISPEVATALGIIAGSGGTAVGIYAAFLGGGALLRRLRGKKKVTR